MKFSIFQQKVQKFLDVELPSGAAIVNDGRSIAKDIRIGRTAFMDRMGVDSEVEYKRQCVRHKKIMFHAHVGMNTWQATAEALGFIFEMAGKNGFTVDRAGLCRI